MHLIYLDESGNTGRNLADTQQPVFVLGALLVPENVWQPVERDLDAAIKQHLPAGAETGIEIHGGDLRQGTGPFKGIAVASRLALRDAWLKIAAAHNLRFLYRAIAKNRYERWQHATFGAGISVNPHLAAFPLVAHVVNSFLRDLGPENLGIFISDENREVIGDIERFQKLLRITPGALRLDRIIEKGFFIDSAQSRLLQLSDICTIQARKLEERKTGLPAKRTDDEGIRLLTPLIYRGQEHFADVIKWLQEVQK